ncbi:MAG: type II toxin-antitoxin system RelE/ParE family toxin [Chloroflexi bacterium]|nr:type II toxin-antitoxin system RelE/ParE family toxin [Chloroflexota bacterium]
MYTVHILKAASRELARLDTPIAKRIVARIHWLAENLDAANPKVLKGELAGLYKLREGDYRIIYEIIRKEKAIVIHSIGHRREIYQKKK